MSYLKKQFSFSLAIMLILSLSLGSLVMAEGEDNTAPISLNESVDNSCTESFNRDHIKMLPQKMVNHQFLDNGIIDNHDGTATAYFRTTEECVRVSFSSYKYPEFTIPNINGTPFEVQSHYDGQSILYPEPGNHSVTIDIPQCAPYQLDVYSGNLLYEIGIGGHAGAYVFAKVNQKGCADIVVNKYINEVGGSPHAGITFELWKNGSLLTSGVTDINGKLTFTDLPVDTYVLKEISLAGFSTDLSTDESITLTNDLTFTKIVINTPKLKLESACSVNPEEKRSWKVTNESNIDVPFTWEVPSSSQAGEGNLPGGTTVTLSTYTVTNSTLKIYWGNEKELSATSEGELCPTPTPTATPTPESTPTPTPTATPTPTPESTPTPTPTATPTPTPESTPTPTPTATTTPTPESTPTPTPTATPTVSNTPTPETTTIVEIDDEKPPIGGIEDQDGEPPIDVVIDVAEDQVPLDTLPKTGESSPVPYYLIGAFALTTGFLTLRKQRQRR